MMQNDLRNSYDLSSLLWIVAVLLAVLFSAPAIAGGNSVDSPQQSAIPDKITIKGTVVDKNSLPVAGATVVAKDRPALGGTVTDHKGHFTFAAPLGTILQISFVGYAPEEKAIDAQTEWIITLQEDNNVIDDIVVVGYGVQKKESVIGAISQVKGDELVDSGTTNLKMLWLARYRACQSSLPAVPRAKSTPRHRFFSEACQAGKATAHWLWSMALNEIWPHSPPMKLHPFPF